jgi:hypothetical protein
MSEGDILPVLKRYACWLRGHEFRRIALEWGIWSERCWRCGKARRDA